VPNAISLGCATHSNCGPLRHGEASVTELWGTGLFERGADLDGCIELFGAARFDGITVSDSQSLRLECWTILGALAVRTQGLKLATLTTNAVTRHPAVTAAAALTVQELSGGRFTLGVGRGDSPLAFIDAGPINVGQLRRFLEIMQRYLSGAEVPFEQIKEFTMPGLPRAAELGYGRVPEASSIVWPRGTQPKVPLDVSASGPKVIAAAAAVADSITLAVGAEPERVAGAIEIARRARSDAGADPSTLRIGAFVNVAVHSDRAVARSLVQGTLAVTARWLAGTRPELAHVTSAYDMTRHGRSQPAPDGALARADIDRLAVVGTPDECIARLKGLSELGLDRIVTLPRLHGLETPEAAEATRLFVEEVIPYVRGEE
jgi:5,10-methylenetetrahydromethanopterin reductase